MSNQPPGLPGQPYPPGGVGPTGYGYGPPPGYYPGPPQQKAAPKKLWYGVGATLLIVGVLVAALGGAGMIGNFSDAAPDAEHTFGNGETTTVHFDAGETRVIFAAEPDENHHVRCNVSTRTGTDDDIKMDNYDGTLTINQWQALFTVTVQKASDYAVKCKGAASDEFGVGGDAKPASLVGGIFAIFGGGILCVAGILTLIITALLRRRRQA